MTAVFLTIILIVPSIFCLADINNQTDACIEFYEKGKTAYLENDFSGCVENFEKSIKLYKSNIQAVQNCRLKCNEEAGQSSPMFPLDVENLHFYEKTVRNTLCLIKCRRSNKEMYTLTRDVENIFEERMPYDYLHSCYFKTKEFQKAASSAFTYLVVHPENKVISKALKYYSSLPDVDMKEIVNFEAKDYIYFYVHGVSNYENEDWKKVELNIEESLLSYLQSEEQCRAQCEGPFLQEAYPDFIPAIANHFMYCLKCKQHCHEKLNNLNGEFYPDLLPSHYHYLQYAYFKNGNLKSACRAAASYILFYPDDEVMRSNMDYYRKLPKFDETYFTARPEALNYMRRNTYEKKLINFVENEFSFEETSSSPKSTDKVKEMSKKYLSEVKLIMDAKDLNGTQRFLADGLMDLSSCVALMDMIKFFGQKGDGYKGNSSPHTENEEFYGLTVGRTVTLAQFGYIDDKKLNLYLQITENARQYIIKTFKLKKKLYFTYTHLVCRTVLNPPNTTKSFSHAVHADNCNLIIDGLCTKDYPVYWWRHYSALIYLNHNFKGGKFVFTKDGAGENIQGSVLPKCGRMVAFSSGPENLHGVRTITSGTRCAIGLWFTFDKKRSEYDRTLAYKFLDKFFEY